MIKIASARLVFRSCVLSIRKNEVNLQFRSIQTRQTMQQSNQLHSSPIANPSAKLIRYADILKSEQDTREYRGLLLDNGLRVILISDPETDKSAAALSVEVGFLSDPEHLPGLAHFCEHMLFLGTKKFPDEDGYTKFLSSNSGSSNASTYAGIFPFT